MQRAITPLIFYGICPKVNQIIYTSYLISLPNIKTLAKISFEIPCLKVSMSQLSKNAKGHISVSKVPKISKGRNPSKFYEIVQS